MSQKAMRLRPAVPKIPAKSSVPPRLPLHKNRPLPTPSKSTLLQLLIPLHFISRRMSVYKKPGGGNPSSTQKFCNSSLRTRHQTGHARVARIPITFMHFRHVSVTHGVYPSPCLLSTPNLFPIYPQRMDICRTAAPATPFLSCIYFTVPFTPAWGLCPLLSRFLCPFLRFRYNLLLAWLKENA